MPPTDAKVPRKEPESHSGIRRSSPILRAVAVRAGVPLDQVGQSGTTFMDEEAAERLKGGFGEIVPKG